MLILGVVVVLAAVAAALALSSFTAGESHASKIDIIGNGTIEENGTLNVKLTNDQGVALKDKSIHVSVKDANGTVVFNQSATTFVNGVANVQLANVTAGEYEVNVAFDGDENYTASSASEKLTVVSSEVEEDVEEDVNATDVEESDSYQTQSGSYSYSPSYSPSYTPSSSDSADNYYEENGNPADPSYDEEISYN